CECALNVCRGFRGFPMTGTNGMNSLAKQLSQPRRLLAYLALCLVAPLTLAQDGGQRTIVADVKIVGARTVSEEKIKQYIDTKPGKEFSKALVLEDVAR